MEGLNNKKIAAVGNKDTILIFKALGVEVFYETEAEGLRETMKKLVAAEYPIILITEQEAMKISDYIDARAAIAYPIILPIPDGVAPSNYGNERIMQKIEKAIGSTGGFK